MSEINVIETLKERQKAEAANRLTAMEVVEEVVQGLLEENIVYISERQNSVFPAVLYYVENYPELVEKIKAFENKYNALVYHVQLTHTQEGKMYSMFYVSSNEEDWAEDFEDIEDNKAYVNVWDPSGIEEIGMIGFKQAMGGICRTW